MVLFFTNVCSVSNPYRIIHNTKQAAIDRSTEFISSKYL